MIMVTLSNWHKARFFDFDFSAAVVKTGIPLEQRANKLGRPSYINVSGESHSIPLRNAGPVIGKDAAGNWWLTATLRKEAWKSVEESVRAMSSKKEL